MRFDHSSVSDCRNWREKRIVEIRSPAKDEQSIGAHESSVSWGERMWNRCSQVMPNVGKPVLVTSKGVHRVALWNGMGWRTQYGSGLNGAIEFWCEIPELVVDGSMNANVLHNEPIHAAQASAESVA